MEQTRRRITAFVAAFVFALACSLLIALPGQAYATNASLTPGTTFSKSTNLALTGKSLYSSNRTEFNDSNDNNFYSFVTSNRDSSYQLTLKVYNNMTVYVTVYDSGRHRIAHFNTSTTTKYTLSDLDRNSKYYVELWRYANDVTHAQYKIAAREIVTPPTDIGGFRVASSEKGKLKVSYWRPYAATGFVVVYKMKGKKWIRVETAKASCVVADLKSGKTYYAKVRPFRIVNGVRYYGNWTAMKSAVIK